jgi:xanthine dehydrogenase accessory factor
VDELLARARELQAWAEPFAVATVVRVERPASARPGMKAIVRSDGSLEGWVGGSCAHPVVVREARIALGEGRPRLISLSPHPRERDAQEGVIHHPMTCHSGGSIEVYIEPVLPRPALMLVGDTPLVAALAGLGRLEGFTIWVAEAAGTSAGPDADLRLPLSELARRITPQTYVVVATMGSGDEEALEQVVGGGAAYVGLVASRKRAEAVQAYLRARGVADEAVRRIKAPAGLDIGAVTPEEIALSIMAEIIKVRRAALPAVEPAEARIPAAAPIGTVTTTATDPICGMTVEIATARYTAQHRGITFYFCSAGCRHAFEREPARYVTAGT